jgi:tetratricopeptide (TPR) repeat protein
MYGTRPKGRAELQVNLLRLNPFKRTAQGAASSIEPTVTPGGSPSSEEVPNLLGRARQYLTQGSHAEAASVYQQILTRDSGNPEALNGFAVALGKRGRFKEAEGFLRRAIEFRPDWPEAQNNLGFVLRALGRFAQAELAIQRAVEADPVQAGFQLNLAYTRLLLGRTREAEACFAKVLEILPDHLDAMVGIGHVARLEGRFDEAENIFQRVLGRDRKNAAVCATLVSLRKMTAADDAWLKVALEITASDLTPTQEAELRFAIGKYWDDLGQFKQAFHSYQYANEILKATAGRYSREARTAFVDDMVRVYSKDAIARIGRGASASTKPVMVVGMPRSGTSLVEQIIASHPAAIGAGELGFWTEVLLEQAARIRREPLAETTAIALAEAYLQLLEEHSTTAQRVVDKAPVNSEYLGFIYSVFPNARVIYVRRHPIDTCLSCYFQHLSPGLTYATDLGDLAHYYREHHRQIAHWQAVLPRGFILEVPYEGLVADQEGWTRRILDFIGLEWHDSCLEFYKTKRAVLTSSSWQVRQKIYRTSVGRWRNYEQFIEPLLGLANLPTLVDGS